MKYPLYKLPGCEVLPNMKDRYAWPSIVGSENHGFNQAINEYENVSIDFNVLELAKELYWIQGINSNPKLRQKAWDICNEKEEYIKTARYLIANPSWIKLVKG